jgi:hypothetical protein
MQLALNQQFQQGCASAQQGMLAEQVGNWPLAAQCYDQSIAIIGNAMTIAGQYGMPVLDNVFANYAVCHFEAARVKAAAGWATVAPAHLAAAWQAISQAIAIRPDVAQYRAAAAMVQAAQRGLSGPTPCTVTVRPDRRCSHPRPPNCWKASETVGRACHQCDAYGQRVR